MTDNPAPTASDKPTVICLMGPTASGKTALALELATRHPFQLISVDSAQIYRDMNIGTGKPDPDTLARFPHSLIDIRDPAQSYSAADFRADAMTAIDAALAAGKTPLLVGGTMLYFKALRDGLAELPRADAATRSEIEELARREGWQAVHSALAAVDPEAAARIHPNDPQRLQRALEVYRVSGQTLSDLHREGQRRGSNDKNLPFNLVFFAIASGERAVLHDRIARRFNQMLADGLLGEVRKLYQRGDLNEDLPSIKSVGYRQAWQYVGGQMDYDQMVEKSIIATRQLAKRQLTWLRSWENLFSLSGSQAQSTAEVLNYVDSNAI